MLPVFTAAGGGAPPILAPMQRHVLLGGALLGAAMLAACGGGGSSADPDAPPSDGGPLDPDAAPDAPADAGPDAPVGEAVRVEASSVEGPLAGVKVAFLDAADALVSMATTDAAGVATGVVPTGGSVVAASPAEDRAYLWRSVAGGTLRARFDLGGATHTVTFSLPTTPVGGMFRVITRCGRTTFTSTRMATAVLPVGCASSGVVAQRFVGVLDSAFYVPAVSLTAATVDLTANTFAALGNYSVSTTGITVSSASMADAVRIGDVLALGMFYGTSNPQGVGSITYSGDSMNIAGSEVVVRFEADYGTAHHQLIYRGPASPPPPAFDAGVRARGVVNPTYSAGTRTMTWLQGAGEPLDAVRGTLVFTRTGLPDLTWELVLPPPAGAASTRLPVLPAALAGIDPGTAAATTRRVRGYTLPGGYARARSAMFADVEPDTLLAAPGLLRLSDSLIP